MHELIASIRTLAATALAIALLGFTPAPAGAQIFDICGDVDDDGLVSVTDGVQVLRAAADLPSNCTEAICDVDVDGTISVTDGVNVLRKAAELPVRDNCIERTGRPDRQIEHLIERTVPLMLDVLPVIVENRRQQADLSIFCDNRVDEGTIDFSFSDGSLEASFSSCLLEGTLIDGTVENAQEDLILSLDVVDLGTDEGITFDGALNSSPLENGLKYTGNLESVPSFELFETGDFFLVFNSFEVETTKAFPFGTVRFDLSPDTNIPDVTRIRMFFDGSNLVTVQVETGLAVETFAYDLVFRRFA